MSKEQMFCDVPLWEVDHPYYCNEATWFSRDTHAHHESADEFLEGFGASDEDLNYVVRWDWKKWDDGTASFFVFEVRQRKGFLYSHEFPVTPVDEPKIRAWLEKRWQTVLANWKPVAA